MTIPRDRAREPVVQLIGFTSVIGWRAPCSLTQGVMTPSVVTLQEVLRHHRTLSRRGREFYESLLEYGDVLAVRVDYLPGAMLWLVTTPKQAQLMTPLRDPIKNLVYNATDEDVEQVYVNGRLVVDEGRVLAADERGILAALQAAGDRMWPRMGKSDWAGRAADQLSPQTYANWDA